VSDATQEHATGRRVLIADDHPPTRVGVRSALEAGGFAVVAEVATGPAAVAAALELAPDICLLDIHMPGGGIVAADRITQLVPSAAVVMLTVSRDDRDLFDALRAGAVGYLLKDMDPDRLPLALQGVLAGEAALPRNLVARLMDEFRGRDSHRLLRRPAPTDARLTAREWEVLDCMREGLRTAEIATRLFVSSVTVRTHISAIMRKLKVSDRETAVRMLRRD
jgi:DNA-binding NarL/FixJ family response regulator